VATITCPALKLIGFILHEVLACNAHPEGVQENLLDF
jgi:hypothetical protein